MAARVGSCVPLARNTRGNDFTEIEAVGLVITYYFVVGSLGRNWHQKKLMTTLNLNKIKAQIQIF